MYIKKGGNFSGVEATRIWNGLPGKVKLETSRMRDGKTQGLY